MTSTANTAPKGIKIARWTISMRDLYYFLVTAVTTFIVAWQAVGSPTDHKALWIIAIGVMPVLFRKIFPNAGEAVPASTPAPAPTVTPPADTPSAA